MRFLIDEALSPMIAEGLRTAGHDAVHVRDIDMKSSPDIAVFDHALRENMVIVSADTDFGALIAGRTGSKRSVILFRGGVDRRPARQVWSYCLRICRHSTRFSKKEASSSSTRHGLVSEGCPSEAQMLNRAALLLRYKQPFID